MWITYLVHWLSVTHQLAATLCFTLMKNKPHWKDIMKLLAIWMIKMESVNCIVKNTMKKKHIQLLLPESIFLLELLPNSRKIQTPQVKSQIFSVYNDTETNLSFKTIWCPDCWLLQCSLPRWWLSVKSTNEPDGSTTSLLLSTVIDSSADSTVSSPARETFPGVPGFYN